MGIMIEYKGWKFEFDSFPSADQLEAMYQERVAKLDREKPTMDPEQGMLEGEFQLAPIQRWFFGQDFREPSYWNHGILYTPPVGYEPELWRKAWAAVMERHDVLRLQFFETEDGGHRQRYVGEVGEVPFDVIEVAADDPEELEEAIRRSHRSLDIENGPICRLVYLKRGEAPHQLLIVIHHLAIGGYSWTILAGDLQQAAHHLAANEPVALPPKTASYRAWVDGTWQHNVTPSEVAYWREPRFSNVAFTLPVDFGEREDNLESTCTTVNLSLEPHYTASLLQVNDVRTVLIAALTESISSWTTEDYVVFSMEGTDRLERLSGTEVDLSRTMGWLNTVYPMLIRRPTDGVNAVSEVAEQLSAVPLHTTPFMMARQSLADRPEFASLAAMGEGDFLFNYYGQLQGEEAQHAVRMISMMRGPGNRRTHALELYAYHNGEQLFTDWIYSKALHKEETITAVAQATLSSLRRLIGEA